MVYDGLTGSLNFDSSGKRIKYKIDIYRIELNTPLNKVT